MDLNAYQRQASETDQRPGNQPDSLLIPLLGLAGEAGTLLSEYKKQLRDGPGHVRFADRVREELGDVLWYLSNVADKMGLTLDDIARDNLNKVSDRWKEIVGEPIFFDDNFPEAEQLPREFEVTFAYDRDSDRAKVVVNREGEPVGNPLTDNAYEEDGYRFHDVYHFTFATCSDGLLSPAATSSGNGRVTPGSMRWRTAGVVGSSRRGSPPLGSRTQANMDTSRRRTESTKRC